MKKIIVAAILTILLVGGIAYGLKLDKSVDELNNPTQIEADGENLYFLDYSLDKTTKQYQQTIKMYNKGYVYDITGWLPSEFRKDYQIKYFKVLSPSQLVILTQTYPPRDWWKDQDNLPVIEHAVYLLDLSKKNMQKIYTKELVYSDTINSIDVDTDGSFYLTFEKQVLKVAPDGQETEIIGLNDLAPELQQQKARFYGILKGKYDRIFVELVQKVPTDIPSTAQSTTLLEVNGQGEIIKSHDPFPGKFFRSLKYEDYTLFSTHYGRLYSYRPGLNTKGGSKLFDVALGDIHYWVVTDMAVYNNEYILLVTDSDTGNSTRVWKLLRDGTIIGNFISTEVTRD